MSKEDIMKSGENKKRGFLSTVFSSLFSTSGDEFDYNDKDVKEAVEKMQAESQANINNIENQCFSDRAQRRAELDKKLKTKGLQVVIPEEETEKSEKAKVADDGMER